MKSIIELLKWEKSTVSVDNMGHLLKVEALVSEEMIRGHSLLEEFNKYLVKRVFDEIYPTVREKLFEPENIEKIINELRFKCVREVWDKEIRK